MIDHNAVAETLQKTRSFTKTAALFGVSKQRIYQLIRDHFPQLVDELKLKRSMKQAEICEKCQQTFYHSIQTKRQYLCYNCKRYLARPRKQIRTRSFQLAQLCSLCGYPFTLGEKRKKNYRNRRYAYKGKTLCSLCYMKTPEMRAKRRVNAVVA